MPNIPYPNPNEFINAIVDWTTHKRLHQIYSQKGGWEGWAQVELAIAFLQWLGGSTQREVDVYTNGKRADILSSHFLGKEIIFELKCQSAYQDMNGNDAFANAFISDLVKVNHTERKAKYQNAERVVIGIGVEGGGVQEAINTFNNQGFAYHDQTFWTQAPNNGPTVFYAVF